MQREPFVSGEFYHIYNRGVDHRNIFLDDIDLRRFFQSMQEFNSLDPVGSLYENSFKQLGGETAKLVNFVAYCLNPNHFHFLVQQVVDNGISEFMKRLGGYTWYFNNKNNRSGSLFQGVYKSVHINSNEYLLHVSAYVNLNNLVHKLGGETAKLCKSSWNEYVEDHEESFCTKKDIVLEQYNSKEEYKEFATSSLEDILERKEQKREMMQALLLE